MKLQYYADHNDVAKWTYAASVALDGPMHRQILYIALLTGLESLRMPSEGKITSLSTYQKVSSFFTIEQRRIRKTIDANIERLGAKINTKIVPISEPFSANERFDYFDTITNWLLFTARHDNIVLLIDPNTGIEHPSVAKTRQKNKHSIKPEYVSIDELKRMWRVLRKGDALLLYQHKNPHVNGWTKRIMELVDKGLRPRRKLYKPVEHSHSLLIRIER